jgi:uncharacterized MAPEG superfamily protein
MTVPLWALLGFAAWTVLLLLSTVGIYRWSRILTGRVPIRDFRADRIEGEDWYRRAMRAHANCVENLPVFGAIVAVATFARMSWPAFDALACTVVIARLAQSLTHVSVPITARSVSFRFTFFSIQLVCMIAQASLIAVHAQGLA